MIRIQDFRTNSPIPGRDMKYVPPGVESWQITDEGFASKKCKDLLKTLPFDQLVASRNCHTEKFLYHQDKLKDLCWYLPNPSDREIMKGVFTTLISGVFPKPYNYYATFVALVGQYGLFMIDNYFDMQDHARLMTWHASLADACNEIILNRKAFKRFYREGGFRKSSSSVGSLAWRGGGSFDAMGRIRPSRNF